MLSPLYRKLPPGFINHQNLKFMNKKTLLGTSFFKMTGLPFLICLILYITSCSSDKNKTADTPSTVQKPEDTIMKAMVDLGDFPVLCIAKTTLQSYYNNGTGPAVQKLVFTFSWNDGRNLNPSLTVYKAKANGEFIGDTVATLDPYDLLLPIQGISLLGNLELTRVKFLRLYANSGTNPSLIFYPVKNGPRVTYRLIWGDCDNLPANLAQLAGEELNPCPPNQPGQGQ